MPERATDAPSTVPDASVEERLRAVERTLTETDRDLTAVADAAERTRRIEALEGRCEEIDSRLDELSAAVQAVRGYVGAVRAVNRDVERRANAALAAAATDRDPGSAGQEAADPGRPGSGTTTPRAVPREGGGENGEFGGEDRVVDREYGESVGEDRVIGGADRESAPEKPERSTDEADSGSSTDPPESASAGSTPGSQFEWGPDPDPEAGSAVPSGDGSSVPAWEESDAAPVDLGWDPVAPTDPDGSGSGDCDDGDPSDRTGGDPGGRDWTNDSDVPDRAPDDQSAGTDPTGRSRSGEPVHPESTTPDRTADWRELRRRSGPGFDDDRPDEGTVDGGGEEAASGTGDPEARRRDPKGDAGSGDSGPGRGGAPTVAGRDSAERSGGPREGASRSGGYGGLEWPPGDGLDVDRAQPWSAPDLPPSDASEEDRSLLDRLREAL